MRKADTDPKVWQLAKDLGIPLRGNLSDRLRQFALDSVRRAVAEWPHQIPSLAELQRFLCAKLDIALEVVSCDADLDRIADEYRFSEAQRRQLRCEFNHDGIEGWLVPHPDPRPGDRQYLALADGRGERFPRAFFTAWHELVHRILTPEQLALEGFRRSIPVDKRKDAVESVVDDIAGHIAFFEPLVRPVFEEELVQNNGELSFAVIESVRLRVAPTASFYSTAIACIRLVNAPVLLVQVDWSLKPSELRRLKSSQHELGLGVMAEATRKLRVIDAIPSDAARRSALKIFRPMRIPESSVIYTVATNEVDDMEAVEDQASWEASGSPLARLILKVQAVRRGRYVFGLIAPRM